MKLGGVVGSLGAQVVYKVVVLVSVLQEPVHLVDVVPVHTLQLLGGEAHRYESVCYICVVIKEIFAYIIPKGSK